MSEYDVQKTQPGGIRPLECDSHHPIIAAIDLGTNSCRLLVARVNVAGVRTNYFRSRPKPLSWKVIDSFAKVVRLGEGLHNNDELSDEAIDRAMEALAICRKKLNRYHLHSLRAVATEACRRAKNNHLLVDRAKRELDLDIEVIDSDEEASLALKGCSAMLNPHVPYGIVFDIGGGSTEVILVKLKKDGRRRHGFAVPFDVIDSISVPYGVVTTTEAVGIPIDTMESHEFLQTRIFEELKGFVEKNNITQLIQNDELQITGSSGTVTTLAAFHLGLAQYERRLIDGMTISYEDLHKVIDRILTMTREERLEQANIGFSRADYVLTGSNILKAICDALPVKTMRIADRGVREGILIDLMLDVIRM
jgi:exopolyphosphatase/guanosine-5'-triphosphate,3'-diphosphate pyrophosphatase